MSVVRQPFVAVNGASGAPYAGASMYFYQTGTTTPVTVYSDAAFTTPLLQPVVANADGRFAPVFAQSSPLLRMKIISVGGVTLEDVDPVNEGDASTVQQTSGTAGGTPDVITVVGNPITSSLPDGLTIVWRASAANTTTTPTLQLDTSAAKVLTKLGGQALAAGDIPGALAEMFSRYNAANNRWELLNPAVSPSGNVPAEGTVASAATTDLSTSKAIRQNVTGAVTITSFGTGVNLLRIVRFSASLVLTHNASSLILPGGTNIQTAAGDVGWFTSDGSGNWRCIGYQPVGGVIRSTFAGVALASSYANITSIALTPGKWRISSHMEIVAAVTATYFKTAISTTTASNAGTTVGISECTNGVNAVPAGAVEIAAFDVTLTANTTYYMNAIGNGTGAGALSGNIRAERII